jgi:hypothetical protein
MAALISAPESRGLSPIQKGVRIDFLENALIDWGDAILPPELTAAICALPRLGSGCALLHRAPRQKGNAFFRYSRGMIDSERGAGHHPRNHPANPTGRHLQYRQDRWLHPNGG